MKLPLALLESLLGNRAHPAWGELAKLVLPQAQAAVYGSYPATPDPEFAVQRAVHPEVLEKAVRAHRHAAERGDLRCDHADCWHHILPYLRRAAVSSAVDQLRKASREPSIGLDDAFLESAADNRSMEPESERTPTAAQERRLLAMREPLQRMTRRWCWISGVERALELADASLAVLGRANPGLGERQWSIRGALFESCLTSVGHALWTPRFRAGLRQRHLEVLLCGYTFEEVASFHGCTVRQVGRALDQAARAGKLERFPLEEIVLQALVLLRASF